MAEFRGLGPRTRICSGNLDKVAPVTPESIEASSVGKETTDTPPHNIVNTYKISQFYNKMGGNESPTLHLDSENPQRRRSLHEEIPKSRRVLEVARLERFETSPDPPTLRILQERYRAVQQQSQRKPVMTTENLSEKRERVPFAELGFNFRRTFRPLPVPMWNQPRRRPESDSDSDSEDPMNSEDEISDKENEMVFNKEDDGLKEIFDDMAMEEDPESEDKRKNRKRHASDGIENQEPGFKKKK